MLRTAVTASRTTVDVKYSEAFVCGITTAVSGSAGDRIGRRAQMAFKAPMRVFQFAE